MADQEQVLIQVQFDTSAVEKAQKALQSNLNALEKNKKELADLNKNIKAGNELTETGAKRYAELNKEIEENKRAIKSNTAIIQAATSERKTENDTLDEQRQYLNTLQKAFAGLTQEQKDAMGGQEALEASIKAVSDALKEQEHAIGDDRRNVGNYTESIQDAFGNIAKSAGDLSPAVSILRSMGGEGKKLGDALDMVGKVMQLVGKAGNAVTTAMKAQTVATEGQTVAQTSLNAVMAANPIGLIVAGISTLLPLIQTFCSNTKEAEAAQKKFNEQAEAYNRILAQRGREEDFELEEMKIMGASELELAKQRQENRKNDYNDAVAYYNKLDQLRQKAHDAGKKKLEEEYETQLAEQQKVVDQTRLAWQKAGDAVALEQLRITQGAVEASNKRQEELEKERNAKLDAAAQKQLDDEKALAIQIMDARLGIAKMEADALVQQEADLVAQSAELLASLGESEEEEEIPTPDEMCRDMFGLDQEGVDYFRSLLDQGVSFAQAKTQAIADQQVRMTKAWATSFGQLGQSFSQMGDMLGEFADDSEGAAKAQKGFAFTAIMLNQAQSIANGALAISEGIASAASLPFPANIPAIISIVAEIAALMAGVGTSIVQAKQIFAQSDAGKFAEGGIVGGTSYTGDKLTANVNSREMILPLDDQKTLFDALSSGTEGNRSLGIDYDLMAAAVAAQPAPVVVYSELQEFGQKVSTYNEIARV